MTSLTFIPLFPTRKPSLRHHISPRCSLAPVKEVYFATCARGLGSYLAHELTSSPVNATLLHIALSGVRFTSSASPFVTGLRACMWLRTAMRVLLQIHEDTLYGDSDYDVAQSLYDVIKGCTEWADILHSGRNFAVQARVSGSVITESTVRVVAKNAICDAVRDATSVKPERPESYAHTDVPVFVVVHKDKVWVYLDCAGESLHKRGYWGKKQQRAGLNETVAAGMLYELGMGVDGSWRGGNIVDPMCGSGTLLLEGMLMRMRVPLGKFRRFAIEGWGTVDREIEEGTGRIEEEWIGNDLDGEMIEQLRSVARRVGLEITLKEGCVSELKVGGVGGIVCNPPWGGRIERGDEWTMLGSFMKREGGKGVILSGDRSGSVGLKVEKKVPVRIGNVDCRMLVYQVWEGSRGNKSIADEEEKMEAEGRVTRQGKKAANKHGRSGKNGSRGNKRTTGPIVYGF